MIFGFNTEVPRDGTLYHVQSELRSREALLQTQVFVSGRCIGKISAPIPEGTPEADAQELLRAQHRGAVSSARQGEIEFVLEDQESPFHLAWEGSGPTFGRGRLNMRFRATNSAEPVPGVVLCVNIEGSGTTVGSSATTDDTGLATISAEIGEAALPESFVQVEAEHGSRRLMRRYRLQRGEKSAPPPTK